MRLGFLFLAIGCPALLLGVPQSGTTTGPQFSGPMTLPQGKVGVPYSYQLTVTGGTLGGSPNFSTPDGGFSPGLVLSPGGLISGTPTAAGNFVVAIQYNDGNYHDPTIQAIFSFNIASSLAVSLNRIQTFYASVGGSPVTGSLFYYLTINGGAPPYTYQVQSGALAPGLQLNSDGSFSGACTATGTYSAVIAVTDSQGASATFPFNEVIEATPLQYVTQSFPPLRLGLPYRLPIEVKGGTPPYSYGGDVCGIEVDGKTGIAAGSPSTCPGSWLGSNVNAYLSVVDSLGMGGGVAIPVSGYVYDTVTSTTLGTFAQTPFVFALPIPSGQPPFIWSAPLPPGINLDPDMGVLSGTVDQPGKLTLPITVTDGNDSPKTDIYTLNVTQNTTGILTSSLPVAVAGQTYSAQLKSVPQTQQWFISAPSGELFLGSYGVDQTGLLTATISPSLPPGDYPVTFQITDATGSIIHKTIPLTVLSPAVHLAPTLSAPRLALGTKKSIPLSAYGGKEPYTFTLNSIQVPAGLQLSPSGVISWTPSAV